MGHGAERFMAFFQDVMCLFAVFSRDETNAAAALLMSVIVKAEGFFAMIQRASSCQDASVMLTYINRSYRVKFLFEKFAWCDQRVIF
jgi:hypothetical protein